MTEAWRCFVAVPLDDELRSGLASAVGTLRATHRETDSRWRWSDPALWHLTLVFLGDTPPSRRSDLEAALREVARASAAFSLPTGGMGAFPSPRAARVLWYGVDDSQGRLRRLADDLCRKTGSHADGPFHPHVTLGRARHRHGTRVGELLRDAHLPPGRLRVDRAVLYRSHLGGGPDRYEILAESPLVAAGAGALT
jgi:RNA 2',3'-cyclic 3'-phosphodiesterase